MGVVDAFIAYKFIKILVTPFEETDAYKLGIIDANGKVLKKRKDLKRSEEKKHTRSFTRFVGTSKRY